MDEMADSRTGDEEEPQLDLLDVTGWPLTEIIWSDADAFTNAMRRRADELAVPQEMYVAFGNRVG